VRLATGSPCTFPLSPSPLSCSRSRPTAAPALTVLKVGLASTPAAHSPRLYPGTHGSTPQGIRDRPNSVWTPGDPALGQPTSYRDFLMGIYPDGPPWWHTNPVCRHGIGGLTRFSRCIKKQPTPADNPQVCWELVRGDTGITEAANLAQIGRSPNRDCLETIAPRVIKHDRRSVESAAATPLLSPAGRWAKAPLNASAARQGKPPLTEYYAISGGVSGGIRSIVSFSSSVQSAQNLERAFPGSVGVCVTGLHRSTWSIAIAKCR
jgi:hypothetical protein